VLAEDEILGEGLCIDSEETYFRGGLHSLPDVADHLLLACAEDRRHVWDDT
jgi:hypothetical protein